MENNKSFNERISYKNEIDEKAKLEEIANKLLSGEKYSSELSDKEVDDMIEYFTQDIEKKDKEIEETRQKILKLKKQLED